MSADCWRYNLTENMIQCYNEHPLDLIIDHWTTFGFFAVLAIFVFYYLWKTGASP